MARSGNRINTTKGNPGQDDDGVLDKFPRKSGRETLSECFSLERLFFQSYPHVCWLPVHESTHSRHQMRFWQFPSLGPSEIPVLIGQGVLKALFSQEPQPDKRTCTGPALFLKDERVGKSGSHHQEGAVSDIFSWKVKFQVHACARQVQGNNFLFWLEGTDAGNIRRNWMLVKSLWHPDVLEHGVSCSSRLRNCTQSCKKWIQDGTVHMFLFTICIPSVKDLESVSCILATKSNAHCLFPGCIERADQ